MYENKVLRRVFGPKRDEVPGEWRKSHNEKLRDLYSLLSIVRIIKCEECDGRGMWHLWERGEVCTEFYWGNLRERDHWGDTNVDGMIILRWMMELAQDRDRWWALVNKVMNFRVP